MFRPGESGAPPVRPIVYHPSAATDPAAYERYADPAAAHGWENAYDETAELPRVPAPQGEAGGRADRRRAARRTGGRPSRRVLAVSGATGAVALAAVVAGLSLFGTTAGERQGKPGGRADTRSSSGDTASPAVSPSPSAEDPTGSAEPSPSASTAAAAAPPPDGTSSSAPAAVPSASDPAAGGPTASDPASPAARGSGKGNSGKGRGLGKGGG
ncbi:hypothetical protein [Streptomyces asoensis]|uniref:hypothetical protein n=1 Tax=Streptomyces asoensis TaxID=249586 RepID=UPI0033FCA148